MNKSVLTIVAVVAVAAIAAVCPGQAQARKGESAVGVNLGFTTKNSAPTAGIFSEHLAIAPAIGCVFRNKGLDNFYANVNVHFPFALSSTVAMYPLAGLSYASWDRHFVIETDIDDVSTRVSRLGMNVGAGLSVQATRSLRVKMEFVGTINKNFSTFSPEIGIGYTF